MHHSRNHLCGAALNDYILVGAGTNDSNSYLSSMEMLDCSTNRWLEIASLNTPRRSCAATSNTNQIGESQLTDRQHCSVKIYVLYKLKDFLFSNYQLNI